MSVTKALFRIHRPIILIFAAIMVVTELTGAGINVARGELNFSFWLVMVGSATRYWLLVIAIILVSMYLRQFVANGVTRHAYVQGAALFTLVMSVGFALAVALGHGLESLLLGLADQRGPDYPVVTAGTLVQEFARVLPGALAWPLTGAVIALGFYRFRAWRGLIVMLLGAIPALVADGLIGVDEFGQYVDSVAYPLALAISLTATAAGAAAFYRLASDVPIRRAAR